MLEWFRRKVAPESIAPPDDERSTSAILPSVRHNFSPVFRQIINCGAKRHDTPVRFSGILSKCISIPISILEFP